MPCSGATEAEQKAAKAFLDYMVNQAGMASALKSVSLKPAGQLSGAPVAGND